MPVYSYRCPECGWREDRLRKMDDRELAVYCQHCRALMRPEFTVAHWNWGPMAAAHGMFIEETRKGYHGMTHTPRKKSKKE